jgi:hypothetical protein
MSTEDDRILTLHQNGEDDQYISKSRKSSIALTLKDDPLGTVIADDSVSREKASVPKGHEDSDALVIDWDGPYDPENPKKRVEEKHTFCTKSHADLKQLAHA